MGWWSATIMGGDGPLDWEGALADVMGVRYDYDSDDLVGPTGSGYPYTREDLERNILNLLKRCSGSRYDRSVATQVLGVMLMAAGAEIPDEVKTLIVEQAEQDEWAGEGDRERMRHIEDFIRAVREHSAGTPTRIRSEGLFEKMFGYPSEITEGE